MGSNAHRTLRISLAAALLLLFAEFGFTAEYTVHKGDTLTRIAKKYGVSIASIQAANSLKSITLNIGQKLVIPSKDSVEVGERVVCGTALEDVLEVVSGNAVVTALDKGTKFRVLERDGDKYRIELDNGSNGWVRAEAVKLSEELDLTAPDVASLIQTAFAYRGSRYVFGGMSSRGFDCSGFVKYLYAGLGIKLPRNSRSQYSQAGTFVSRAELKPGDLIFFSGTYRRGISHVGLYVGEGKFIHASTPRSGVRVDHLDSAYYSRHFVGAKRIK
ncbi:MAG TPA: NlpC/P60 family protein [Armatimonadota bacterium]|nr:NlpC/P60 family protein [Armatimonadota bacterium]